LGGISLRLLALNDNELDTVMAAARPLAPDLRDAFLHAVAHALRGHEIGPGLVARTCRELQRDFLDPPDLDGRMPRVSKWER
jgi:hypothetical protein